VRVHVKVVEGEKERIQVFEGAVIARKGLLNTETFTVRKVSYGVGVERIFPLHSPIVTRVEVMRQGKVRRAKLYYLRGKKGKFAKVEDREFVASVKGQPGTTSKDEEPAGVASAAEPPPHFPIPLAPTVRCPFTDASRGHIVGPTDEFELEA